jgi:hypothetical protein
MISALHDWRAAARPTHVETLMRLKIMTLYVQSPA